MGKAVCVDGPSCTSMGRRVGHVSLQYDVFSFEFRFTALRRGIKRVLTPVICWFWRIRVLRRRIGGRFWRRRRRFLVIQKPPGLPGVDVRLTEAVLSPVQISALGRFEREGGFQKKSGP